jgi:hypothetical protein
MQHQVTFEKRFFRVSKYQAVYQSRRLDTLFSTEMGPQLRSALSFVASDVREPFNPNVIRPLSQPLSSIDSIHTIKRHKAVTSSLMSFLRKQRDLKLAESDEKIDKWDALHTPDITVYPDSITKDKWQLNTGFTPRFSQLQDGLHPKARLSTQWLQVNGINRSMRKNLTRPSHRHFNS